MKTFDYKLPTGKRMSKKTILVVEDDASLREALCETLQMAGFGTVDAAHGQAALPMLERGDIGLVISDVQMASMDGHALLQEVKGRWRELPVVLMTAYGSIERAVAAMRDGAADYLVKPFEAQVLIEMVSRFLPAMDQRNSGIIAVDPCTREMVELATRVAGTDATVMLSGESGTGKEVFARLIHQLSPRRNAPFKALNCAAIPETMLESMLFGYEKGAFTGAYQARAGSFEQAQGGTLLLDEISEMDIGLQAKLLRVIQEREVERLGGQQPIKLDVRVLATTNRNLRAEVEQGRFREDLFYRLNVFPLNVAPLRQRRDDIVPLAENFVASFAAPGAGTVITEEAKLKLIGHDWPGNIRELQNVVQRALILAVGDTIRFEDIRFEEAVRNYADSVAPTGTSHYGGASALSDADVGTENGLGDDLRNREQQLILDALCAERGRRKETAERLGISPRTLRYKLAKLREEGVRLPAAVGA